MTLQELLKNDEDKRSDHGGKSGEWLADGDSIRWRRACQSPRWHVHQGAGDITQSLHQSPERLVSGIKHRSHYWSASCENQSLTVCLIWKMNVICFGRSAYTTHAHLCQCFNHLLHIIGIWNWVPNLFVFWRWNLKKGTVRTKIEYTGLSFGLLGYLSTYVVFGESRPILEISPVQMSTFSWI